VGLENKPQVLWAVSKRAGSDHAGAAWFWGNGQLGCGFSWRCALPLLLLFEKASPTQKPCGYETPELKAANHRLDGALWPRGSESGTPEQPVVLLEVQMHSKAGFKHRLAAQGFRFLQLHPQVEHLEVVVVVPHHRLRLGPDRLPRLLTLPVLPNPEIPGATEQILQPRPDLLEPVLSILGHRFPYLTRKEIMALINLPTDHLRHTRWAQEWIEEGRQEGEARGEARGRAAEAAAMAIRQLNHRCGPLSAATTARIQALPLQQLESLADALLDFAGDDDLASWLAEHAG